MMTLGEAVLTLVVIGIFAVLWFLLPSDACPACESRDREVELGVPAYAGGPPAGREVCGGCGLPVSQFEKVREEKRIAEGNNQTLPLKNMSQW